MQEIVVLSGKGGTGKTSIVGSLAANPTIKQNNEFWSGQIAYIDYDKCTQCGLCQDLCRFDAIHDFKVDKISCEGCAFCTHICPAEAITMKENLSGHWFISDSKYGPLVHARLGIAEENSGKLVALVRQQAKIIAEQNNNDFIISDGPPGIGCPVISSLSGVKMALLVTEPTLSGIHDLERVVEVCNHFGVRPLVCINKNNINEDNTRSIEKYCEEKNIEIVARIPFDNVVTEALVQGIPVVEYSQGEVTAEIKNLWNKIKTILKDI
jgi:MinD superfamily P-loop ATPase